MTRSTIYLYLKSKLEPYHVKSISWLMISQSLHIPGVKRNLSSTTPSSFKQIREQHHYQVRIRLLPPLDRTNLMGAWFQLAGWSGPRYLQDSKNLWENGSSLQEAKLHGSLASLAFDLNRKVASRETQGSYLNRTTPPSTIKSIPLP